MQTLLRRTGGFTLIELLSVISIMGILVAIAVPVFSNAKKASAEKGADASTVTSTATSTDVGGSFPWGIVLAVFGLLAVGAWLFVMAQVNKAKEEQAAAETNAPDAGDASAEAYAQDAANGLSFTKDDAPAFDPLAKAADAPTEVNGDQAVRAQAGSL